MPNNTFLLKPYSLASQIADQISGEFPAILRPLVRPLAKHYAKEFYANAGITAFTATQVHAVPPQPLRRPSRPAPQAAGAAFNPHATGMDQFHGHQPPPYSAKPAPHERYAPPPGPPPQHAQTRHAPPNYPPPNHTSPHHAPRPYAHTYTPPDSPPRGVPPQAPPLSTFPQPLPFHLQPPPADDAIGAQLHAQLNEIMATMHATAGVPGWESHATGHPTMPAPAHAAPAQLDPREQADIDRAIALSLKEATAGPHGMPPAHARDEQQSVAHALAGLRKIPPLETAVTPWDKLGDTERAAYANATEYLEEASAHVTRTDRIAKVLAGHDMMLIPNSGNTRRTPAEGAPGADPNWATNNCLLISLMQHATGDYDSDHAPLVNQFRAIIEQDPSMGIRPGDKLPAQGRIADGIVSLINNGLGLERPLRMVTVSDASGVLHVETAGPDDDHRRDVIVVDMGGHFEAAAPASVIAARRAQDESPRRGAPATRDDATPSTGSNTPAPPAGMDAMSELANAQMRSTLIQQHQQIAETTRQARSSMVSLTAP